MKYHITPEGIVEECKKENCKIGIAHFDSLSEAQKQRNRYEMAVMVGDTDTINEFNALKEGNIKKEVVKPTKHNTERHKTRTPLTRTPLTRTPLTRTPLHSKRMRRKEAVSPQNPIKENIIKIDGKTSPSDIAALMWEHPNDIKISSEYYAKYKERNSKVDIGKEFVESLGLNKDTLYFNRIAKAINMNLSKSGVNIGIHIGDFVDTDNIKKIIFNNIEERISHGILDIADTDYICSIYGDPKYNTLSINSISDLRRDYNTIGNEYKDIMMDIYIKSQLVYVNSWIERKDMRFFKRRPYIEYPIVLFEEENKIKFLTFLYN